MATERERDHFPEDAAAVWVAAPDFPGYEFSTVRGGSVRSVRGRKLVMSLYAGKWMKTPGYLVRNAKGKRKFITKANAAALARSMGG